MLLLRHTIQGGQESWVAMQPKAGIAPPKGKGQMAKEVAGDGRMIGGAWACYYSLA